MINDTTEMQTFGPLGIGDVNSQEKGSGARFNGGKPDFSLIPMVTLEDEARVWGYGKDKYSSRGDCTCNAGNAARKLLGAGATNAQTAGVNTKSNCEPVIQNSLSAKEQTGESGTQRTPTESRKLSESAGQCEHLIPCTKSNPSTEEFSLNTDLAGSSTTPSSQQAAQSAAQPSVRMSIIATPPGLFEECYAIPATSALDFSKGLAAGLAAHSPTCGVHRKLKTAAWNWTKGMPWSVPFACAMRHMAAWQRGEECDPESGLPHLAHAMCNLRMLTLYASTYQQGDDRPTKELQP